MVTFHGLNPFLFFIHCKWKSPSSDPTGCDVNLTVTEMKQYFATEGYPNGYMNNEDCYFNFEAPPGRRIVIFFVGFHLEHEFDYIHLRKLPNFNKRYLVNAIRV